MSFIISHMHLRTVLHTTAITYFLWVNSAYAGNFTDMLRQVLTTHPQLEAEREALKSAQSSVNEAYAGFFPSANLEYDRGRQNIKFNSFSSEYATTDSRQLVVTQPVFNGGGTIARVGSAQASEKAEAARLELTGQQIVLRAITAYADVSEKQEVLTLSWQKVQALTDHLKATNRQFSVGELTITDVSQSEARLARAEAQLKDAQAALDVAITTYKRETGLEANSIDGIPPIPLVLPASEEEIRQLVATHPALETAKQNERAADYTIDERRSAILPQVNLQGQIDNNQRITQPGLNQVNQRAVMLQVVIPIFQGGAEYARLSQAGHEYNRARNNTLDTNRQVIEAALSEWHNFKAAEQVISSYEQSTAAAQKALKSVEIERLAGTRTVLDVLNAQEELYSDRIALAQAKTRYVVGSYRLLVATGILSSAKIPQNA